MKTAAIVLSATALAVLAFVPAMAQQTTGSPSATTTEPLGGQPPPGAEQFEEQVVYHRAFEALFGLSRQREFTAFAEGCSRWP